MVINKVHPIASLFPEISDLEFKELKKSIKDHGQLVPGIVMKDGTLLDGRHRRKACKKLGVSFKTIPYKGEEDDASIAAFLAGLNLHRRHLTTKQRAAIAAEMANMQQGGIGANQYKKKAKGPKDPAAISIKQAADTMKVSERSVKRAKKQMREDPKAHEATKRGDRIPPKPKKQKKPVEATKAFAHVAVKVKEFLTDKSDIGRQLQDIDEVVGNPDFILSDEDEKMLERLLIRLEELASQANTWHTSLSTKLKARKAGLRIVN